MVRFKSAGNADAGLNYGVIHLYGKFYIILAETSKTIAIRHVIGA